MIVFSLKKVAPTDAQQTPTGGFCGKGAMRLSRFGGLGDPQQAAWVYTHALLATIINTCGLQET